jgi:hypothetical protein
VRRAFLIGLALALMLGGILSAAVLRRMVQIARIAPPRAEDQLPAKLRAHILADLLAALLRHLDREFPRARAFRRPAFDTHASAG